MRLQQTEFSGNEELRRVLEAKWTELTTSHHSAEAITIERVPDSMDQLVFANERDLAVDTLNREAILFRQVSEALNRIAADAYGICLGCDEPISCKRLAALPWAALCLECQEAADNSQNRGMKAGPTAWLSDAA